MKHLDITLGGGRVFKQALTLATTLLACAALQANDQDKQAGHSGDKAEKFIKEAYQGNQLEVQMGQLAQQQAQNQEVKTLAQTLVKDHQMANQKLQPIAQQKNIQLSQTLDQKHQQHLQKLQGKSGAEFDKMFVQHAIKDHKKGISKYEKCSQEVQDQQLKAYVDEVLPKLRNHLQMAQSAARTVGVDEATIAADVETDESAVGAPAPGETGESDTSEQPQSQPDNQQDNNTILQPESDQQSTTEDPILRSDADIDVDRTDSSLSTDADIDVDQTDDSLTAETDVDVDDGGVFEKGDGEVLGLPTDKNDGTFLGIIPNPRADNDDADASIEADIDADVETEEAVGGAARSESGTSTSKNDLK